MKVEIKANILKDLKNICITIDAPELTEEVQNIIDYISNISKKQSQIIADKDNKIYILELKDVICFFSKDKYNYVRTVNGIYRIKMKLYELEEVLDKNDFIKIYHPAKKMTFLSVMQLIGNGVSIAAHREISII